MPASASVRPSAFPPPFTFLYGPAAGRAARDSLVAQPAVLSGRLQLASLYVEEGD